MRRPVKRTLILCIFTLSLALGFVRVSPAIASICTEIDCQGTAYGINDANQIVGMSGLHGFLCDMSGSFTPIDYPGATHTVCYGINDAGMIVGKYQDAGVVTWRGFLRYTDGVFIPIDYLGATSTECFGINNGGNIVGRYWAGGKWHGFLYNDGGFTPIDYSIYGTGCTGINNAGQIVGWYKGSDGKETGFLRDAGGGLTTFRYPGNKKTTCAGINNAGQIVGHYYGGGDWRGFFRDVDGGFTPIACGGSTLTKCTGINDAGQIVGNAYTGSPGARGWMYVATPAVCKCSTDSPKGCISGYVTTSPMGWPMANMTVILERKFNNTWVKIGEINTRIDGCYIFSDLEDGRYRVTIENCRGGGAKIKEVIGGGKVNNVNFSCRIFGKPGK